MFEQQQQQSVSTSTSSSDNSGNGKPIDLAQESFSANQRSIANSYLQNPSAGVTQLKTSIGWLAMGALFASVAWWLLSKEPQGLAELLRAMQNVGGVR